MAAVLPETSYSGKAIIFLIGALYLLPMTTGHLCRVSSLKMG
jgi:hypothetical protein